MTRSNSRLHADVRWALKGAYSFAAVYCVWVLILYLIRGDEPFKQLGVSFLRVEFFYLAAAGVGGSIVALLRPLTRWAFGAYVVGFVAGVIMSAGMAFLLSGSPIQWGLRELVLMFILAVLATSLIGPELKPYPAQQKNRRSLFD